MSTTTTTPTPPRRTAPTATSPPPPRETRADVRETVVLAKLAAWLSPGFPVGAYSYSQGLEWAVEAGDVRDPATLGAWVAASLTQGAARTDAILLALAWADPEDATAADLAAALQPSRERRLETTAMGAAFAATVAAAWPTAGLVSEPAPYPVAVGRAAKAHGAPLRATLVLFLHALAANMVSAGVRLIPIGQTDGQRLLADLLETCEAVAGEAAAAGLDDLGAMTPRADIATMRHETQHTRLFRT
ncbi:MAG: urease accessory protein UreF [Rhodobacteraceae bacterium]|nr:MAG: urease accessory protein UreF [Paracoccaceae bacterium]